MQVQSAVQRMAEPEWETVIEIFFSALKKVPNRRYAKSATADLTYQEAALAAGAIAARLGDGVCGRPVAFFMPNSVSMLITYLAVLSCGGEPALLNPALPVKMRDHLLENLDAAAVVTLDDKFPHENVVSIHDADLKALAEEGKTLVSKAGPEDIAVYLFSGGTTGVPKRVGHSHRAICGAIERMEWGWPTNDGEVWLPIAPFTHVYGFLMGVTNPMLNAGSIIIPDRFHPATIVDMLEEYGVTVFGGGPPAIYQGLLSVEGFGPDKIPALRVCPGGGAPFPIELHRRWKDITGLNIYEGYGMTEIAPIAVNTEGDGTRAGAAGKPVPDTEVQIVDLETGETVLPHGQAGEIRVRGPHQMTGYSDHPEENAIMLRGGWVYTGDIGVIDDAGFLTITDRKKNVIFHKGFNVFPRELEEAIMEHEAVAAVSVVGAPDERSGEIAVAFVQLREAVSVEALMQHCTENLVSYKMPARIEILEKLPLTPAGKPDRLAMAEMAKS